MSHYCAQGNPNFTFVLQSDLSTNSILFMTMTEHEVVSPLLLKRAAVIFTYLQYTGDSTPIITQWGWLPVSTFWLFTFNPGGHIPVKINNYDTS